MVVGVDAGKDRIKAEVYIFLVDDVLSGRFILVAFALSEIYDEDERRLAA